MKNALPALISIALLFALFVFLYPQTGEKESNKVTLHILSHSSFTSSVGPGPLLKKEFENTCNCKVRFINGGDAGVLLQRLSMDKKLSVDVLMGLDQFTIEKAKKTHAWKVISPDLFAKISSKVPKIESPYFLPYDWAPMAFIYRKNELDPPKNLDGLMADDLLKGVALQDPRSSTPGLQFLYWVFESQGEVGLREYFNNLKKYTHSVSPSWSSSYGLFQKKQAKLVFSYITSLIYHWKEEGDLSYKASLFEGGQPVQVEFLALSERGKNNELAIQWTQFILSPLAQKIIAENNYMLPVVDNVNLHSSFLKLPKWKVLKKENFNHFILNKEKLIKIWKEASQ